MSNTTKTQKEIARFEIKGALKNLNIAEPTRIPKEIVLQPPSLPQNEGPQSKRPHNEAPQNEPPQKASAATGGFFPLSHGAFENPRLRELSGDGFRIFLWLSCQAWRFRNSIGQVRASVSWISKATAVSEASVSRILGVLQTEKLLRRVKVDYQTGNIWEVEDLLRAGSYSEAKTSSLNPKQKEPSHFEDPQNEEGSPSKRGSSSIILREQHPQNEGHIRNLRTQESKNSLSVPISDERLARYFGGLKPAEKRESEKMHFEKLRTDYSEQDIAEALDLLLRKGMPESGVPCHSPLAFLAKAMDQILGLLAAFRKRAKLPVFIGIFEDGAVSFTHPYRG